eukprot:scaffold7440_cov417-Prasinococcus_capsulatus_cf.AAC.1
MAHSDAIGPTRGSRFRGLTSTVARKKDTTLHITGFTQLAIRISMRHGAARSEVRSAAVRHTPGGQGVGGGAFVAGASAGCARAYGLGRGAAWARSAFSPAPARLSACARPLAPAPCTDCTLALAAGRRSRRVVSPVTKHAAQSKGHAAIVAGARGAHYYSRIWPLGRAQPCARAAVETGRGPHRTPTASRLVRPLLGPARAPFGPVAAPFRLGPAPPATGRRAAHAPARGG